MLLFEWFDEAMSSSSAPQVIFYACLIFGCVDYLFKAYLALRQIRVLRASTSLPVELVGVMTPSIFEKTRLMSLERIMTDTARDVLVQAFFDYFLMSQGLRSFWTAAGSLSSALRLNHEAVQSAAFYLGLIFLQKLIRLPFAAYDNFVRKERHGLAKQTLSDFAKQQIIELVATQVLGVLFAETIVLIDWAGGNYGFLYLWLLMTVALVSFGCVCPAYVAPRIGFFTALPVGNLRTQVEALAVSVGFPPDKIYDIAVPEQVGLPIGGACSFGCCGSEGIAMFGMIPEDSEVTLELVLNWPEENEEQGQIDDVGEEQEQIDDVGEEQEQIDGVLEEQEQIDGEASTQPITIPDVLVVLAQENPHFTIPQVLAVLAHELGHWKLHHVFKKALMAEARLFLNFGLFAALRPRPELYSAFGFASGERPAFVGFLIVQHVAALLNLILEFVFKRLEWRFEYAADAFAVGLGRGADLATGLLKYTELLPSFPILDTQYAAFYQTHPPILNRVTAINDAQ